MTVRASTVLDVNGRRFARTKNDFAKHDCVGYWRNRGGGVLLLNSSNEPIAYVVNNRRGEQFIVTAHMAHGRVRFMFSTDSITERFLGIENFSCSQDGELAKQVIDQLHRLESAEAAA